MDSTQPASSLQKTSPPTDPAVFSHLTSELSAQANQLAAHHQQLSRLTIMTEELMKAVQSLHQPVSPPTAPAPHPDPVPTEMPHSPLSANPRLAFPEKFDGSPNKCKGFLMQCSIFLAQQPSLYSMDYSKISLVCSLLTGKALDWATAVWNNQGFQHTTYSNFIQRLREVFEHAEGGRNAGEQLLALRQGRDTAAEFALKILHSRCPNCVGR